MRPILLTRTAPSPLWTDAQVVGMVLTVGLVAGLVVWPAPTLRVLWDMVIPVLPAVFLINPMLWRNVCPLGTLNELTGRRGAEPVGRGLLQAGWIVGLILLALMVPARRFLFNEDGLVLALTIAAVGGLALAAGLRFPRRSGFCNSVCPVLPVEKLYGQAPLVGMEGPRCVSCDICTPAGCIDLAGGKSARQSLSSPGRARWLLSPFGIFAAAFPGFIIGYFTTDNGALATAPSVYLHVATWAAGSYLVAAALVAAIRPVVSTALVLLGGAAVGVYYWFAAPGLAAAYGAPDAGPTVVRVLAFGLVAAWAVHAFRRQASTPPPPSPAG